MKCEVWGEKRNKIHDESHFQGETEREESAYLRKEIVKHLDYDECGLFYRLQFVTVYFMIQGLVSQQ